MAEVIFPFDSKQAAEEKMGELGFGDHYGRIGFTDFSIKVNYGVGPSEEYFREMEGIKEYCIVGSSNYHVESTIISQYNKESW